MKRWAAGATPKRPYSKLTDVNGNTHAWMNTVVHVIVAIGVHDVNVIRVAPTDRPRIDEPERVAAIREAPAIVIASVHMETVSAAEVGCVMVVVNTAMLGIASVSIPTACLLHLSLVPSSVTLLCAIRLTRLWLLSTDGLLCVL